MYLTFRFFLCDTISQYTGTLKIFDDKKLSSLLNNAIFSDMNKSNNKSIASVQPHG